MKTKCNHTPDPDQPDGYIAWHEWAQKKLETHKQIRCPNCGKYAIWVEREDNEAR